ncbi:choline dehydrogenase [Pseudomonas guariconensis]|uniref:choline dehydrogenase n=1 Tax=Pseudomonas guariconensis TaxID=1288410 RepID=UPI00209A6D9D|nr:choline dehydrogenase [Pseudomonas guariconensis]MCO7623074.1 choline dehydrogenase [Pseudomonas guariconensis]
MLGHEYDYVIIGAGSAGCVLAKRLGENPALRILVLESGPPDASWTIDMPSAVGIVVGGTRFNWRYSSEPEPGLDGRRIGTPRGRTLGGSSSINGMVYIRGHARDYDGWAEHGCEGWSYREVLPYFIRAQNHRDGADRYRGGAGLLHVTPGDTSSPLCQAFIEAGQQAGYGASGDLNGYRQEGFGPVDRTTRDGKRWSAARGYLAEALQGGNVTVATSALSRRILFDGDQAYGVELEMDGAVHQVRVRREVLLSAGAINSPQLLMLSGVGPAEDLQRLGIPVVRDLPGVGQRLNDHPDTVVQYRCKQPVSIYPWTRAPGKWLIGARWFASHDGLAASNHFEAGAFIRSRAGVEFPDLQLTFMPLAVQPGSVDLVPEHAFQVHIDLMRPTSLGSVSLTSADPHQAPRILFNYLTSERDRADMRAGARLVREILAQPAMRAYAGDELVPGADQVSDAQLDAWARRVTETGYHASGTCKMGPAGDPEAVVDPQLRVHGLRGLRVVDASIMPQIVSGNTNAPTVMIAEKASDLIRGHDPLPANDAPVWIHPHWRQCQR